MTSSAKRGWRRSRRSEYLTSWLRPAKGDDAEAAGGGSTAGGRRDERRRDAASRRQRSSCATRRCSASSCEQPSARAVSYIARACCASSSITSSSGICEAPANAALTRDFQSILISGGGAHLYLIVKAPKATPYARLGGGLKDP